MTDSTHTGTVTLKKNTTNAMYTGPLAVRDHYQTLSLVRVLTNNTKTNKKSKHDKRTLTQHKDYTQKTDKIFAIQSIFNPAQETWTLRKQNIELTEEQEMNDKTWFTVHI